MGVWTGPSDTTYYFEGSGGFLGAMETELNKLTGEQKLRFHQRVEYTMTGNITATNERNGVMDYWHVKGFIDPAMLAIIYEDLNDYVLTGDPVLTDTQLTDIYHGRLPNPYTDYDFGYRPSMSDASLIIGEIPPILLIALILMVVIK